MMLVRQSFNILKTSKYFSTNYNNARYAEISSKDDKKNIYYKQRGNKQAEEAGSRPANWDKAKPYKNIPGPKPLPLIGSAWVLVSGKYKNADISAAQKMLYADYGKILALKNIPGKNDMVLLYSGEDVENMMRNEGIWPVRGNLESVTYYKTVVRKDVYKDAPGLVAMDGEEWFKFRTIANPILMQPRNIQQYVGVMDLVTSDFIKRIKILQKSHPQGEMPIDFDNEIKKWSLESIMYVALDKRLNCLDDEPNEEVQTIINAVNGAFRLMFKLDYTPSLLGTNDPEWKKFVEHMDTITDVFKKLIDDAQDRIQNRAANIELEKDFNKSIFEKFLEINKNVAISMGIDMLTAGVDTTSKTLGACLYYLAKNKRAQAKLREELVKLMPNPDTPLTKEILENASYLKATTKEIGRIAPIAVVTARTMTKDTVIGGYQIPKGVDVFAANYVMTGMEENFPNSQEFRPERFLRGTTDEYVFQNTNPYIYMPFGHGPRSCIGKRIALLELEVGLAKILRNFHLDWPHEDVTFSTELTYGIKDPLRIHMTPVQE